MRRGLLVSTGQYVILLVMKIKQNWNLGLLYKSDKDPQIEKDLRAIENAYTTFENKYRGKPFIKSPQSLSEALNDFEKMQKTVSSTKPVWYFKLKKDLNSEDTRSSALATKYDQRITDASNKIKFFEVEISKIPASKYKTFLNHKDLQPYVYFLKKIFNNAKHYLSEPEEQLEDLFSQTSYIMWIEARDRLLNQQSISYKGKNLPITKAINMLSDMPKKDRRIAGEKINQTLKSIAQIAEAEINAIYNYKKVVDERRGFKNSYSATILGYQNDEKAIENFTALVTKYFRIAHRFYRLHAKLLKEKKLTYSDRATTIGVIKKKFDFLSSVELLRDVFGKIDPEYRKIFEQFLEKGQIDVLPKKGKRGGAYCSDMADLPTYVLLNHVDSVNSLETLAHEMGHAFHSEMSKGQPVLYRDYTISTAEVASTFFEQAASEEMKKTLSPKEKIIMLHNRIRGDVTTIFRQVACFNFEKDLHDKIRKEGKVSAEDLAVLMNKHLKSYLGDAVELAEDDGYQFVSWMHIRRFFYVYTYAYGQLISRALYENYKKDSSYGEKIKQFLKAGGSMSPEEIFKSIGIDTSKPAFFEAGLKSIERDIERLEKLTS